MLEEWSTSYAATWVEWSSPYGTRMLYIESEDFSIKPIHQTWGMKKDLTQQLTTQNLLRPRQFLFILKALNTKSVHLEYKVIIGMV